MNKASFTTLASVVKALNVQEQRKKWISSIIINRKEEILYRKTRSRY